MQAQNNTRRLFLQKTVITGMASVASPLMSYLPAEKERMDTRNQLTFLFQGDSITDGNRGRNNDPNHIMGHGYAFSIASRAGAAFPGMKNTFYNRGISGNTITDLITRWQKDALDIKPDVLSVLVGVNDTELALKQKDAEATRKYEEGYRTLLNTTKTRLPGCLLVLCEPFIAPVGRVKEAWEDWQTEIQKKQAVVQRLTKEYRTLFVPLQKVFNNAVSRAPADYWIWDGIHPTVAGHELITQQWLKEVGKRLHFLKRLL